MTARYTQRTCPWYNHRLVGNGNDNDVSDSGGDGVDNSGDDGGDNNDSSDNNDSGDADGGDVDLISFAFDIVCVHGFDLININAFGIFEAHQQLG